MVKKTTFYKIGLDCLLLAVLAPVKGGLLVEGSETPTELPAQQLLSVLLTLQAIQYPLNWGIDGSLHSIPPTVITKVAMEFVPKRIEVWFVPDFSLLYQR